VGMAEEPSKTGDTADMKEQNLSGPWRVTGGSGRRDPDV
jgi:hypothetical protein